MKRSLEDVLKEKFSHQELTATPGSWDKIQHGLSKKKTNKAIYYLLAASFAGIFIVSVFLLSRQKSTFNNQSSVALKAPLKKVDTIFTNRKPETSLKNVEEVASSEIEHKNEIHKDVLKTWIISTENSKEEKRMPDSSLVSLNDFSKVTMMYGTNGSRMVELHGEAYFSVKNIKNAPFKIVAGNAVVEVIGTAFNVRIFSQDSVEVLVEEGKVKFGKRNSNDFVILTRGKKGLLTLDGVKELHEFSRNQLAWKTGEIEFKKTKMSDAILVLEDYFKTKIRVSDKGVLNCHVTAKFRQPHLDKVLDLFSALTQIKYEKKDQEYILTGKGCD